ncbi:DegT/DnrJ/EryC1/StrS family aminotransferase [Candidatus Peribacteria bacterium]|nr:DegT/DnrJ/EryC1/StrS family aminotransferase [Candidatus Peribacteria bacterium]
MSKDTLAINGGTPLRTKPWQESNALGEEEKHAMLRAMESGHLSLFQGAYKPAPPYNFLGGPEVQALENMATEMTGAKYVVAMNSATSGLYAAVGALGLGYGDEVIVSPYTMSACAVAPLIYGAIPVFADIEETTGCLDPVSIEKNITKRTKGILVVHQFGIPANMKAIMQIAKKHHLKVIEDCAQAWGATIGSQWVGTFGDIGVFSFNVHKTIQCGEGGLCITNDEHLSLRLRMIRNHGEAVVEAAQYEEIANIIGFNYRLTEPLAAVAQEQLKKLESLNDARLAMVKALHAGVAKHRCLMPMQPNTGTQATYYVCPMRYFAEHCGGTSRSAFTAALKAEGIPFVESYVKPLYELPLFKTRTAFTKGYPWSAPENKDSSARYETGMCPTAERLFAKEMLLNMHLCHPQTVDDVTDIIAAIDKVVAACTS